MATKKKMQKGGAQDMVDAMYKAQGKKAPTTKETLKYVKKKGSGYLPPVKEGMDKPKKMKTGGMVNPNANLQATKSAGSKGVKPGVNPKAAASKVARGRSGGTSTAPKTATPRAKYGMSVKRK
jgi:hypothetical protein